VKPTALFVGQAVEQLKLFTGRAELSGVGGKQHMWVCGALFVGQAVEQLNLQHCLWGRRWSSSSCSQVGATIHM
jgi:hypothetical protein